MQEIYYDGGISYCEKPEKFSVLIWVELDGMSENKWK